MTNYVSDIQSETVLRKGSSGFTGANTCQLVQIGVADLMRGETID